MTNTLTCPLCGNTTALGRQWRIEFPPGEELLNANQRRDRRQKAQIVKNLRQIGQTLTRHAKVPPLSRAHILGLIEPPDNRIRDPLNWADSVKPAVDGVVKAGVLPDDNPRYLVGPDIRLGPLHPLGRLVLVITELSTPQEGNL